MLGRKKAAIITGKGVIVAILGMGVFRYGQWEKTETIVLPGGKAVSDVPRSETGVFGGPKWVSLRRRYLANQERYRALPMAGVEVNGTTLKGAELFIPAMTERLASDPATTAALARLPSGSANDLGKAMTLVFSRVAGLPRETYRNQLITDRKWEGPPVLPQFWDYMPGKKLTDDAEANFISAYEALNLSEGRLTAVASSAAGWRVVVRSVSSRRGGKENILFSTLSSEDVEMFDGGNASGAMNFHRWPADWESYSKEHPMIHMAEAVAIIQTANGDRYPLRGVFIYDTAIDRWRLIEVSRHSTVRVARVGILTF